MKIISGLSIVVALFVIACSTESSVEVIQTIVPSPLPSPVVPVTDTPTPEPTVEDSTPAPEPTATPTPLGSWDILSPLNHARSEHFAVRLDDGRVLVGGGFSQAEVTGTTEIYSPIDDTWAETGELNVARANGVATLLQDGRVLVTGGNFGGDAFETALDSVEMFDPLTGVWKLIAPMASKRSVHTATKLGDGRVLVAGGFGGGDFGLSDNVQLFNPETNSWESGQEDFRISPHHSCLAQTLANGPPPVHWVRNGGSVGRLPSNPALIHVTGP